MYYKVGLGDTGREFTNNALVKIIFSKLTLHTYVHIHALLLHNFCAQDCMREIRIVTTHIFINIYTH